MTTPSEPSDDTPTLPAAPVPATGPTTGPSTGPALPPAAPQQIPTGDAEVFDAKAMVEAMKSHKESPLYGGLPTATPESRAAAQALREEARRKRKRNKRLGWYVALFLLAVVLVAGFLAYREYQAEQDRRDAEAAAEARGADDGRAEAADLGDVLAGQSAQTGGLADIMDRAEALIGDAETDGDGFASPPSTVDIPEYRTIGFQYRIYDSAGVDVGFSDFLYTYDVESDHYFAFYDRSDADGDEVWAFTDDWAATVRPDGTAERVRRSAASADPGLDSPWATAFGVEQVITPDLEPFNTPVGDGAYNDRGEWRESFLVDTNAFRAERPEAHADWLAFWTAPAATSDSFVDTSVRQVAEAVDEGEALASRQSDDLSALEIEPRADGRALIWTVRDGDGYVVALQILDPDSDVRVIWVLDEFSDEPARGLLDYLDWVDAP